MVISEIYQKVKPCVVAIAVAHNPVGKFPQIIGTGFLIREDGIVLTNRHILDTLPKLPPVENEKTIYDRMVVLYFDTSEQEHVRIVPLRIEENFIVDLKLPKGALYYGEDTIDVGVIVLKNVRDCPFLKFFDGAYDEGTEIALAGFPMGTRNLTAPGWLHQIGPTLQKGIIAGVLPMPCKTPHAVLLDIMVQGGSSGSPVFSLIDGSVIGIVYAGLQESYLEQKDPDKKFYKVPTSLTLAIPSWLLLQVLQRIETEESVNLLRSKKIPISEWMKQLNIRRQTPKAPFSHD